MWKLQPTESGGESVILLAGQEYVVGRKNCEILLTNDQSISRVHAVLTVTEQAVTLKDSSKYGTFVNGEKLESGSTKTLQTGYKITFGVFQSKFSLEKECIVVCSSCVDNEGKVTLSQDIRSVGGRLVSSWTSDCTHLVMPTVKVTIKTICALLCCRPIVKPAFFSALSKAVQQKLPLPKAERFRPQIDEPSLARDDVDLSARPERKSLFKGKTFLFLSSKQMKRLSVAVSCGGGVSQLLDEGALPVSLLESSSTCVLDMISGNSQPVISPASKKWLDSVGQILHRKGLRFITESEVGLAAIHVSNQTYCNPCSSLQSESVKTNPVFASATLSQSTAVDETALAAPSQNITAYVVNTEISQDQSRMVTSGISAVGETPEKTNPTQKASTTNKPLSLGQEPSSTRIVQETVMSSESFSVVESEQKMKKGSVVSARGRVEGPVKQKAPSSGNTTLKHSPQKQTALTSFFQPSSKKRPRESSASSVQPEPKFFKKDIKDNEDDIQQSFSVNRSHKTSSEETSLGQACGTGQNSSSKKRKEPEQDTLLGAEEPTAADDLEMSLEELEFLMSDEMDEPPQTAANKKQRLESGLTSKINSEQLSNQQEVTESKGRKGEKNQQSSSSNIQSMQLDRAGPAVTNQDTQTQSKRSPPDLEAHSSANKGPSKNKTPELEEVKKEEVSFVVNSRPQNGISQTSEAVLKQEMQASTSNSGPKNDPDLPRKLLQVQFMSLTVNNSSRSRPGPLQTHNPNDKNVKRFRKKNVPGFDGLPKIIGGSDLVAHNRSKHSELEEWLRQAAEEEKLNEREETLGDDLFRYNPRPAKKR
uniref:Nibrin n=1 Tax=Danio rerio TaxID=7955 RepID=NBN_DANRE|nr:RecName: Full=Nibrin; AltName: Full=Nijmegen breakage syndrome protein 1 homolog [Danio rerio]AAI62723.1 Zgc:194152 [Danio rerio]